MLAQNFGICSPCACDITRSRPGNSNWALVLLQVRFAQGRARVPLLCIPVASLTRRLSWPYWDLIARECASEIIRLEPSNKRSPLGAIGLGLGSWKGHQEWPHCRGWAEWRGRDMEFLRTTCTTSERRLVLLMEQERGTLLLLAVWNPWWAQRWPWFLFHCEGRGNGQKAKHRTIEKTA